jgi:flavin-dependent dehydrogenase
MTKRYDVVIVGAGPGGAMAAKTAAENGLKTLLLERKTDPAEITRGCAMMFAVESGYYFSERMYYNNKNKKMIFPVNGFSVDYDGPTRNYYAWHFYAPDGKTRLAFGDYDKALTGGDEGRLSFVYDKGKLIEGLLNDAQRNGVDIVTGCNVTGVEKKERGVKVTGNGDTFEGTFVIGADGVNSRVAECMGFNKERRFFGVARGTTRYVRGLNMDQSECVITAMCFKPDASFPIVFWVIPSPYGEDEYWFQTPVDFEYVTQKSVFSSWFPEVQVVRAVPFVIALWSPVTEPYKDNVLLVGDAAWFSEAEITGSMMCGWKAAQAITVALRDNKPDREGVCSYSDWWKKSYPEFDDYRNFLMIMPFCRIFSEKELNYFYGLFTAPLPPNNNPFKVVRMVKEALRPVFTKIQNEMPSLAHKLALLEIDTIDSLVPTIKKQEFFKE